MEKLLLNHSVNMNHIGSFERCVSFSSTRIKIYSEADSFMWKCNFVLYWIISSGGGKRAEILLDNGPWLRAYHMYRMIIVCRKR